MPALQRNNRIQSPTVLSDLSELQTPNLPSLVPVVPVATLLGWHPFSHVHVLHGRDRRLYLELFSVKRLIHSGLPNF